MRSGTSIGLGVLVLLALLSGGCASRGPDESAETSRREEVETIGFLEDYSELEPGREGQAKLIRIDASVDFSAYSEMLIDPVVALEGPGGEPAEDARALAWRFDAALRRELALEFALVDRPGAEAFRIRAAVARRGDAWVVLEVDLLDSTTGRRVVGAVDHHRIAPVEDGPDALEYWAVLIRNRLAVLRQFDSAARARDAGLLEGAVDP